NDSESFPPTRVLVMDIRAKGNSLIAVAIGDSSHSEVFKYRIRSIKVDNGAFSIEAEDMGELKSAMTLQGFGRGDAKLYGFLSATVKFLLRRGGTGVPQRIRFLKFPEGYFNIVHALSSKAASAVGSAK